MNFTFMLEVLNFPRIQLRSVNLDWLGELKVGTNLEDL